MHIRHLLSTLLLLTLCTWAQAQDTQGDQTWLPLSHYVVPTATQSKPIITTTPTGQNGYLQLDQPLPIQRLRVDTAVATGIDGTIYYTCLLISSHSHPDLQLEWGQYMNLNHKGRLTVNGEPHDNIGVMQPDGSLIYDLSPYGNDLYIWGIQNNLSPEQIGIDVPYATQHPIINVIGDSYVANHRRPKEETWHYKMAQQLGMSYNGYGRNGSSIAFDRTHDGPHNFGPAMWQRYKAMAPDADYVLIIAGHNDAYKVKDNADSLQMFADSLEVMLTGIEQHCPNARIGFVTPWYLDKPGFTDVVRVIQQACQRHNIPLLNNYNADCVIDVRSEAFRARYFQHSTDTAHLNADGHDLFLPIAMQWFTSEVVHP